MTDYLITKNGRKIELLSEDEDRRVTEAALSDPDALPLTDEDIAEIERQLRERRAAKLVAK